MAGLHAGAAIADITPADSQFLFGYPHVNRYSTGVNDPLLSTALYLSDGVTQAIFVANDAISCRGRAQGVCVRQSTQPLVCRRRTSCSPRPTPTRRRRRLST